MNFYCTQDDMDEGFDPEVEEAAALEATLEDERIERELAEERASEEALMVAEMMAEAEAARWDDDPSPYDGTYSEC